MNTYRFKYLVISAVLALAFFIMPTVAMAQTTMCDASGAVGSGDGEITASDIPLTISDSGVYCLTEDIFANIPKYTVSAAIEITSDNVVLDLNGHILDNYTSGNDSGVIGIYNSSTSDNITIKNGTISHFYYGINILGDNHLVEDMTIINAVSFGIHISSADQAIVRNNRIMGTGWGDYRGSAFGINGNNSNNTVCTNNHISNTHGSSGVGVGIQLSGSNLLILNNHISNTSSETTYAKGIIIAGSSSSAIIEGNSSRGHSGTTSAGIYAESADSVLAVNNRVSDAALGFRFRGAYRDNIASAVTTGYYSATGTNLGNNH